MGFVSSISKWFKSDGKKSVSMQAKGVTGDQLALSSSFAHGNEAGYKALSNALSMDQDILYRYSDYENMDDYPEISAGYDIVADDSTITDNVRGRAIWGESKDRVFRDIIDDLLHRRLRIEEFIWEHVRSLCKYGNLFGSIAVDTDGVHGIKALPAPTMRRIVNANGTLVGFVQDLSGRFVFTHEQLEDLKKFKKSVEEGGMVFFEPWEIVHWRLRSKHVNSLYGFSIFDGTRWVWKRLVMFEDTSLLYKLERSPARLAFYIDTGDMPPADASAYVRKTKQGYRKKSILNSSTGQLEFRNNPISPMEDMWIPTRGGKDSTRIEVLSGPEWQSVEDMEYFKDKLFTSMKIPRAYFGGDADASQSLAQRDVRFARTCMRIQREYRNGIRHLIRVHMAAIGVDPDSVDWNTKMTAPSSIMELQQIETMNAQAGLIAALQEYYPIDWLHERVMHLSKDEATILIRGKAEETENSMLNQAKTMKEIQDKYPGVDISGMAEAPPDPQQQSNEEVKKRLDKIDGALKETIHGNNSMVKKIDEMQMVKKFARWNLSQRGKKDGIRKGI